MLFVARRPRRRHDVPEKTWRRRWRRREREREEDGGGGGGASVREIACNLRRRPRRARAFAPACLCG